MSPSQNKDQNRTDCFRRFSARAVSRHPRILSRRPHCTVKLKQLREPIFVSQPEQISNSRFPLVGMYAVGSAGLLTMTRQAST